MSRNAMLVLVVFAVAMVIADASSSSGGRTKGRSGSYYSSVGTSSEYSNSRSRSTYSANSNGAEDSVKPMPHCLDELIYHECQCNCNCEDLVCQ